MCRGITSIHARRRTTRLNAFQREGPRDRHGGSRRGSSTLVTPSFPVGEEMWWRPQLQLTVTQLLCFATSKAPGHSVTVFLNARVCKARGRKPQKSTQKPAPSPIQDGRFPWDVACLVLLFKMLLWLKTVLVFLLFLLSLVSFLPALSRDYCSVVCATCETHRPK